MHAHFAGDVTEDHMPIFKLHTKSCVGQILKNLTLHLDDVVFRHFSGVRQLPGAVQLALKFAFFSRESYC